jgi:hypothetical protein
MQKKSKLIRIKELTLVEILPKLGTKYIEIEGVRVRADTKRMQCFRVHGTVCGLCGIRAEFFALERDVRTDKEFLNLYGVDEWSEKEVLFTVDHIVPRWKLGNSEMNNLRTMCAHCNQTLGRLSQIRFDIHKKREMKRSREEREGYYEENSFPDARDAGNS